MFLKQKTKSPSEKYLEIISEKKNVLTCSKTLQTYITREDIPVITGTRTKVKKLVASENKI